MIRDCVARSSADSGSSSSRIAGSVTSALASPTRCRSPPEISAGRRSSRCAMWNDAAIAEVRACRSSPDRRDSQ